MINFIKHLLRKIEKSVEESRRREAEKRQMLRDNLEAWNELNKDFIEENNRRIDREIDEKYDFTKVPEPDAYNFDGSPLKP